MQEYIVEGQICRQRNIMENFYQKKKQTCAHSRMFRRGLGGSGVKVWWCCALSCAVREGLVGQGDG